jgi:hypothetical protein
LLELHNGEKIAKGWTDCTPPLRRRERRIVRIDEYPGIEAIFDRVKRSQRIGGRPMGFFLPRRPELFG